MEKPGEHPDDPYVNDIDPLAFALSRVQTMLVWIEEHRASFEALRGDDPKEAEKELKYLRNVAFQAIKYMNRLSELVLSGYQIDPNKRLPKDLIAGHFQEWCNRLAEKASADAELSSQADQKVEPT